MYCVSVASDYLFFFLFLKMKTVPCMFSGKGKSADDGNGIEIWTPSLLGSRCYRWWPLNVEDRCGAADVLSRS